MVRALSSVPVVVAAAVCLSACGGSPRRRHAPVEVPAKAKAAVRIARSYLPEEERKRPIPKDCSDFVGSVYKEDGVALPRSSKAMAEKGILVASSKELRMGDLVFFSGSRGGSEVGHVGIYVNNGIFIHQANPGEGVRMESLYSDYYRKRYLKGRRIVE
ncbi:MAG: hypothetical protein A2506_02770 [Elusimicrobia bacterium RIFOXYD12_FULL_66_9]|nr:MAG: hypothetical protein A2506_02770 [Elusimicrobia bacterium RIFOXYD12_FULL_66_9]